VITRLFSHLTQVFLHSFRRLTKAFESLEIGACELVIIHWSLKNEGFVPQCRMIQNSPEAILPNFALADIFVAIEMRTQSAFRIVGMDDLHVRDTEDLLGVRDGLLKARRSGDIEARGEEVAGIETVGKGKMTVALAEIANHAQFLEFRAELMAGTDGVLKQNRETFGFEIMSRFGKAEHEGCDALLYWLIFVIARVQDKIVRANFLRTIQLTTEGPNGFFANHWIDAGEVCEVVRVDNERVEIPGFACFAEPLNVGGIKPGCAPHAGAGGEDLKGIPTELMALQGRVFE